jgi:mRNA-degrading endonuclease RelE of RelBE toxin-antitoxin system
MEFWELKGFTEIIERIASDEELLSLQLELVDNPVKGKLVQKTRGARKIRMPVRGRGKSGGARVIYYFQDKNDIIWMLTAYLKSEKTELTQNEIRDISEIIKEIKGGLL